MILSATSPDAILNGVSLQVAGRVLRFVPADPDVTFSVQGVRSSFAVDDRASPDCVVTCEYGVPVPDESPLIADGSPMWELRRRRSGDDEITFYSREDNARVAWSQLVVSPGFREAHVLQRRNWGGSQALRVGYPLDELLMCRLLVSRGVPVVHGAAVEYEGMGLLFTGHSGAGKSTIAAIAEATGARVLSDDRSIITGVDSNPIVWGTPWHGTHRQGSPEPVKLTAMFLLVQAPADEVAQVSPARATSEVVVRLIHPGARSQDMELLLDGVAAVAERVPMAELRFRPTKTAFLLAADFARNGS